MIHFPIIATKSSAELFECEVLSIEYNVCSKANFKHVIVRRRGSTGLRECLNLSFIDGKDNCDLIRVGMKLAVEGHFALSGGYNNIIVTHCIMGDTWSDLDATVHPHREVDPISLSDRNV